MMASSIESIVDKLQRLSEPRLKLLSEFVDFLDSQESSTEQSIAQISGSKSTLDSDTFANLLDQLINQVTQARGKDAPILSDYAVSRAGIYEEHDQVVIYLVDTNVLLRVIEEQHPIHARLKATVQRLTQEGHTLKMTTQNCVEFWNVATRPIDRNGFGLKVVSANQALAKLENIFPRIIDSPLIYDEWRRLVVEFEVSGVQVHDARLVAAMRFHGITHILTMNTKDFKRYEAEGIVAVDPLNLVE